VFTDFIRDHAFTIAWFGLMAFVWFGWGQEDPPPAWRSWLGAGSVMGLLLAGLFGYGVFARWSEGSALEGRYPWFGLVVGLEVLLAVVGCLFLHRRGKGRWMAWWVALVVALHFVPLASSSMTCPWPAWGSSRQLGSLRWFLGSGASSSPAVWSHPGWASPCWSSPVSLPCCSWFGRVLLGEGRRGGVPFCALTSGSGKK